MCMVFCGSALLQNGVYFDFDFDFVWLDSDWDNREACVGRPSWN